MILDFCSHDVKSPHQNLSKFATMLSVNNLSYYLGDRPLYENASLHIKPKDKIGLIGLNGTGKSTLLKLIVGTYQADAGTISKAKDCTIGFLNQDLLSYQSDEPIVDVALQAFQEAIHVQHEMDKVIREMETDYKDELVDKLSKLQEKFESLDGYVLQAKAEEILEGIGFKTKDLQKPLKQFSGGWRMRVMLAKLLLEKPALLMLDEPTNHLDLPSIQWVESYLRSYEGAIIVVSHDRQFLDNMVTSIVEVDQQQLITYSGNYSFYQQERTLRREIQQNAFENQQQKIKQTERFIERFRSKATKARQVQSRVKSLERMDRVGEVIDENATVNFKFSFKQRSGRHVVTLEDISKSYGPLEILKNTDAIIERGDKIALIGANGKGKSTLLRVIAGSEPHEGDRNLGHNVTPTFFAQHQLEALNVEQEILDELKQAGSEKTETELRGVLGCFLFTDDDVFKKIKVLSGGEKSRVALAKTLISEANFLLLDEPTNHLDMQSENILIQALQQYEGTFLLVSHNRHFIRETANKIWYIEDREIKEYPGTYDEYEYWLGTQKEEKPSQQETQKTNTTSLKKSKTRKVDNSGVEKLKRELTEIENRVFTLEEKKETYEAKLSSTEIYNNSDELADLQKKYAQLRSKLEEEQKKWEEIVLKIEEMS